LKRFLLLAFVLSLPLVTARIYASDEVEGFAWLHSLAFDRDLSFGNEYAYFYSSGQVKNPGFRETFLEGRTEIGRYRNFTTMGAAVLWAPFYGMGHVAARLTGRPANGLSQPYITAVAIGSATYGFLALLLSLALTRRLIGDAGFATAAVWLGTPLLFYMYVTPLFTHACSAFAVALFLWTWLRIRERWSLAGALAVGLTGGLMTIVRAQDVLFIAGPALDFLRFSINSLRSPGLNDTRSPWTRPIGAVFAGAVGFLVAYSPQLAAFKALNGHFRQSIYETRKMTWTSPHGWEVLLDRQHGLFFWTPLALVALVGLLLLLVLPQQDRITPARNRPGLPAGSRWIGLLALIMFALQAYIAGAVESWTVAGAFGQRRFVSLTPLIVLGIAGLFSAIPRSRQPARWLAAAAVMACVWWNLGLMAQFGMHTMDRERLTLRDNTWQSFVRLPRAAPALVWRYLTNRGSFYNQPRQ
jgi:hypothetical protein